jgi:gliding motility-associated-like protein
VCSGSTLLSGTIGGGQAFTQGGLTCGGTFSSFGSAVLSYRCDGPGNPATFGNGEWRLYAWNAGDASGGSGAWSTGYSGYLTSPNLSFNTTSFWTSGGSPSDYVGFLGCHVAADAHSWSAKRQNFPCAVYNISIPNHDDAYQLFINGVLRSSHTAGCCDDHGVVWTGVLNSSSTVEFRVSEGGGGSEAQIVLTPVITAALNGGGLSGNQTICTGGDPTVLTGTAATGGAGPAYENGSYTYEWIQQDNCTGGGLAIGGTNAVNYDPPTGLTTTRCYYRTVIDACGNDKSVGPVTVTVVADPTITAPTFTNGSICPGGSTTMNVTTPNPGTGTPTYTWQYFNGSTWVSAANGVPAGSVYSGLGTTTVGVSGITGIATHQYRVVYSTTGSGCGSVTSGTGQLVVFSEPAVSAPSLTNTTICAGGSSDATVTASSGTGAYGYQWQYFDGASWINVTSGVPTGAAYVNPNGATMSISGITAPGAYQYRNRVTAAGSGCDPVTSTAVTLTVNPDPVATAPTLTNATVCVGGSSTISSTVSGGVTLGYQWQYFNGGAWSNVVANTPAGATYSGATTTSLTVSGVTATGSHSYRLFVTSSGSDCGSTASTAGVLNVVTGPAVTAPSFTNSPICVGGSSSAGVTASSGSGTYSYVWQYNNGGTWANVTNATPAGSVYSNQTTATLGVAGITATGSYQYRSIVSASGSGCVPAVSSTATLTVVADPTVSAATLTNTTICTGGGSNASVTASSGTGAYAYDWQFNNGGTWIPATSGVPAGAAYVNTTAATMTISGITVPGTYQYRARVTDSGSGCDAVTSTSVTLTVNADPAVPTPSLTNATICTGGSTVVNATATGGVALSYQWQFDNGGWANVANGVPTGATYSGNGTSALTVAGVTVTGSHSYRVIVSSTGSDCNTVVSATGVLTVVTQPSVTISGAGTFCASGSSNLTSSVLNGTGTAGYQWQTSSDNVTFTNIPSANASSYATPAVSSTTYYRVIYTTAGSGCGAAVSNVETVTIVPVIVNNVIPDYQKFCQLGDPVLIVGGNVTGGTGSYTYAWQQSTNGGVTWASATGTNNQPNYDPPATSSTIRYRRIVTSGVCSDVSNDALILVLPLPQVNNVTSTPVLCFGGNTGTITVTGSTSNGAVYYSINNGGSYQPSGVFTGLVANNYTVVIQDDSLCTNTYVGNPVQITQPTDLIHTTSFIDASCSNVFDGQISISASGGTVPYEYSLNGGPTQAGNQFLGLSAGTYLVSVFDDNGCVDTSSVTLVNTYAVVGSIDTVINVSCFGGANGSVTVHLSSGIPPYNYSLNGGSFGPSGTFASLTAGVYIIAGRDSKGCTDYITVTITQPAQLTALIDVVNNVACFGNSTGEIFISVNGGTSPYTYLWSNGSTAQDNLNLPIGTYNVTVTDANGCVTSIGATITQPTQLNISLASSQNLRCFNDSSGRVDVTVNGGVTPYVYTWSNGSASEDLIGIHAGTYTLTVQDANNCVQTATYTIQQPTQLTATLNSSNATCNGSANGSADLTVFGGVTPYTFNWSNGATTEDLTGVVSGTYLVTITDANNCTLLRSATITQPSSLGLTSVITNVACFGGTGAVDLTVTGGTAPFSYAWNTGDTIQDLVAVSAGTYMVTVTDSNFCAAQLTAVVIQPPVLSLAATVNHVTCNAANNGSINLTVNGGVPPYSFNWSNSATSEDVSGLGGGSISVTVTDANSCIVQGSYVINEPPALTASIAGTNITCFGLANGSADLTPGGGTPPYTYLWSNFQATQDINSLSPGWYYVIITDANSCTKRDSVLITQPPQIVLSATVTNLLCNGSGTGAINLNVVGGVGPYTFGWSNGETTEDIDTLAAGTYTVTVTDATSCAATATYTITQPTPLNVTLASFSNVSCFGGNNGSISVGVTGGNSPYFFAWSNGSSSQNLSNAVAGTYTLVVTDANSCNDTLTQVITEPAQLTASAVATGTIACNGGTTGIDLTVAGGTTPYQYFWNNGSTSEDLFFVGAGTYTVAVTDGHYCNATATVVISQPPALTISAIVVSPVCNGAATGSIDVSVVGGTSPYTYLWSNSDTTQDLTGIGVGVYSVTVTDTNSCVATGTYTIVQPPALVISLASYTDVSCNGGTDGTVDITMNGGTAPYTFAWSNSTSNEDIVNVPAGTYVLTVTDANSCTDTFTQVISEPTLLVATASAGTILCNGDTVNVDLTVTGGTPGYSYLWSNAATTEDLTGVNAGTYTALVTDAQGCTATASVVIGEPALLTISTQATQVLCNGDTTGAVDITVSGGTVGNGYTFSWSNGASTEDVTGLTAGTYCVTVTDGNGCNATACVTITQPTAMVMNATPVDVACNGGNSGSIDITVNGGVFPYTYLWSTSATTEDVNGLSGGTYGVTVTDANGCVLTQSFTITEPTALTTTLTGANVSCAGAADGSTNLTPGGGTPPYTFLWSTFQTVEDLSNVGGGTYYVIVTDANGCTKNDSIVITEPAALVLTTQVTQVLCNGDSTGFIDLSVSGGTVGAGYTYSWSNGATTQDVAALPAGTYCVTVTDANSCNDSVCVTITQPAALVLNATPVDVACNGGNSGSIDITVNGGVFPYSYLWSTGAVTEDVNGLSGGTYSVTITDANLCVLIDTFTINEPTALVTSVTGVNVTCAGAANGSTDLTVTGGTPPYTFLWSTFQGSEDLSNIGGGTYYVIVTDANGCTKKDSIIITEPAPLVLTTQATQVLCNGDSTGAVDLTVTGGTIGTGNYSFSWSNGDTTEDISVLTAGTYCVVVTDSNNCTATTCVVITQPPAMVLNATPVNVACNGGNSGSIDITVNGGVFPYTYLWSTGATTEDVNGLSGGTYGVTVTDANGCVLTQSFTITEPTPLVTSITGVNVRCAGAANGSTNLTVTGGTAPYSFLWNTFQTVEDLNNISGGTYYVIVTDANGCTKHDSIVITEPTPLVLTTVDTQVLCNGASTGAINLSVSGGTPGTGYTFIWSNGATTEDISGLPAGTYCVTVTDANLCVDSICVTLTQPTALAMSGVVQHVSCNGGSNGGVNVSVLGGVFPYNYLWSTGYMFEDVVGLPAGTHSVTVTDANGCTISQSFVVNEPTAITSTLTKIDVTCNGAANGSIDLTVTGGTQPYSYFWSNFFTSEDISGLAGGTYFVIITDANGCIHRDSITVNEPAPLILTTAGTNITCFNSNNGSIDLTVIGGTLPYGYLWSNSDTVQDPTGLPGGTYAVTVTDGNGCTATTSVFIVNPPLLTVNFIVKTPLCFLDTNASIDLIPTGGTPGYTYLWSNGDSTEDLTNVTAGTYTVSVTDSKGCVAIDSTTISEPEPLVTSGVVKNVTCSGDCDGYIVITAYGGTLPYHYLWSNGASTKDLYSVCGGNYYVSVTDGNGCQVASLYIVNEPTQLTLSLVGTNVLCYGAQTGTAAAIPGGGVLPYEYLWDDFTNDSLRNGLGAGRYGMLLTDSNGCQVIDSIHITQPTEITIADSITNVQCFAGTNGAINITVAGGTPVYTYLWSNAAVTEDIAAINQGNYTVSVTDANSCLKTKSFTVTQPTQISLQVLEDQPSCFESKNGSLSVVATQGVGPYTYLWSTQPAQTTASASNLFAGAYSVTVTDAANCSTTAAATLAQPAEIVVETEATSSKCFNTATGQVVITVTGGDQPYIYELNGIAQASDTFTSLNAGDYVVLVSDVNGCEGTTNFSISSPGEIAIDLSVSQQVILTGMTTTLIANASSTLPIINYIWSPDSLMDYSPCADPANCTTPYARPNTTTLYTVTVMNSDSCTASDTITVIVENELSVFIPTAFTPNGDGLNDRFEFDILGANLIEVSVINRWGEVIYYNPSQPNGMTGSNGWDGTSDGKAVPDDTYVYKMTVTYFDGTVKYKTGTVTIMR